MNRVKLAGKVTRVEYLRYTPAGQPLLSFTIAVEQHRLDATSMGYIEAEVYGPQAETWKPRIGTKIELEGELFQRSYKDRRGFKQSEIKVVAKEIRLG